MAKSCARFQPVKPGSEEHNRRLKKLDYVREELTKNNQSWSAQSVHDRYEQIKQLVKEKTGRSIQSKATPIREAVVLLNQETTLQDLHRLRATYKEHFGIDVFQIYVHKDEGHFNKKGEWIGNYHAHITADFTNHETGKSLKLTWQQMSELQTVTAEVLGMERGIPSSRKALTALQYKIEAERKNLEELRKEVASMDVSKAFKQRLLGFLGMSTKDAMIGAQSEEIGRLKEQLKKLKEQYKLLKAAKESAEQELKEWPGRINNLQKSDAAQLQAAEHSRDIWYQKAQELQKEINKLRPSQEQREVHQLKR